MNKNNKFKDLFAKKGFTIALYSCAAAIAVIAGVVSVNNMKTAKQPDETPPEISLEQANQSNVKSYTEANTETETRQKTAENKALPEISEKSEKSQKTTAKSSENTTTQPQTNTNTNKSTVNTSDNSKKIFSQFDDTKDMSWPVSGQIVMDYSMETAIYDKTLDQYRTNDSICIAAPIGTEVKASAEGIVESVFKDEEGGQNIVINHGNGWLSTYSQLDENILVKEGEVITEGAVIGAVGEPSYYHVLLGPHLEFKLTKDDNNTDPKLVLASIEE